MIDPDALEDKAKSKLRDLANYLGDNIWIALGVAFLLGVVAGAVGG